jgi:predicted RNA-binding protein associated with RNAse of E/G family
MVRPPAPFPRVHIHYRRPPNHLTIYRQDLVHDDGRVKVTFARNISLPKAVQVDGEVVLEPGSDVIWFTYPGLWHDVGRFHGADGRFTGIYANILTPCVFQPGHDWETTDLFLDLWLPAEGGPPQVLDAEELQIAEEAGVLSRRLAEQARDEVTRLLRLWEQGAWPAPEVHTWTRDRILAEYRAR